MPHFGEFHLVCVDAASGAVAVVAVFLEEASETDSALAPLLAAMGDLGSQVSAVECDAGL